MLIGTGATGFPSGILTVTFNAAATSEAVEAVVENLTYQNLFDTPNASRTVTLNLADGAGQTISNTLAPAFIEKTGVNNPMNGLNFGASTKSQFADLDFDGDLDLLNGAFNGQLTYFLNTGTSVAPTWLAQTGGANPFNGVDVGYHARPTLADIDGDGDLDAYIGEGFGGSMRFYRNTGSATSPAFTQETGGANPFNGITWKYVADPTLADFDGDGDYDLMIAAEDGINPDPDTSFRFWRNTGTATAPVFAEQLGANNPLNGVDVGNSNNAIFADIDNDEDLDLVSGFDNGQLRYFRNTGTAIAPVFVEQTGAANPFNGIDVGYQAAMPSFADLDGDGDLDLIMDGYSGVRYWQNTGSAFTMAINVTAENDAPTGTDKFIEILEDQSRVLALADFGYSDQDAHPFTAVKINSLASVGTLKLNGSNVVAGQTIAASAITAGQLVFNLGPNAFNTTYDAQFTFQVQDNGGSGGEGDLDPTPNTIFIYVEAVNDAPVLSGFATSVTFDENVSGGLLDASVTFSDPESNFDGGVLTLSGLLSEDTVSLRNQGGAPGEIGFNAGNGQVSFGGTLIGTATGGSGADFRIVFNASATAAAIEAVVENLIYSNASNAPTASRTLSLQIVEGDWDFTEQTGAANPFNGIFIPYRTTPSLADLDGDGDLDIVIGSHPGPMYYFSNEGTATAPNYVQFTGAANPLNGINVGGESTPTFGDFDGDGDLDAVIGESDGNFNFFENTGTPSAAAFTQRTGAANPLDAVDTVFNSVSAFGDFDGDGDLDGVIGNAFNIEYYRNDGTAASPSFVKQTGGANPFPAGSNHAFSPAIGDLDGDGDLDVLAGNNSGFFLLYRNVGSAAAPAFVLDGSFATDIGYNSKPTLGDIDGDGDLDLVAGNNNGFVRYFKNDGSGAFIEVDVAPVNDAPSGTDKTVAINEGEGPYVFAASDFGFGDVDGHALAAVKITTIAGEGALTLDGVAVNAGDFVSVAALAAGDLVFTPAAGEDGLAYGGFTFQVQDSGGILNGGVDLDQSANSFTIDVIGINDPPEGTDKTVTVLEDGAYVFAAADFGFSDPEEGHSLLAVKITTLPDLGTLTLDGVAVDADDFVGAAALAAGELVFTPAANANGPAYADFTFQVQDNGGTAIGGVDLDQSPNTITIDVTAVNDAPTLTGLVTSATFAENSVNGELQLLDADVAVGDVEGNWNGGKLEVTGIPAGETLWLKHEGSGAGQVGFDYGTRDVSFGGVLIGTSTGGLGSSFVVTFNAAATTAAIDAVVQRLAYGNSIQDPAPTRTVTVTVKDAADAASASTDVLITVNAMNDAPSGAEKTVTFAEDSTYAFTVADFGFSDLDGDSLAAVKLTQLPAAGTLLLDGAAVTTGQEVSAADIAAGLLTFNLGANANGAYAALFFQVRDDGGTANGGTDLDQSPNSILMNVTAVNDAPSGADNTVTALEDGSYVFAAADFGFDDTADGHAFSAVTIATLPALGSLKLNGTAVTVDQSVAVADIESGLLVFTPAANANSPTYASFTFQVQDDGGTAGGGVDLDQSANLMTLAVTAVNDAPSGADKTVTILEDASYALAAADFGFTDALDGNLLAAVKIATLPVNGSLKLNGVAVTAAQSVSAADIAAGLLVYTPALNGNGTGHANFTFQVQDNGGTTNSGVDLDQSANTITFNVTSVNDAPSGADKTITSNEDAIYTLAAADFGFSDAIDGNGFQAVRISSVATAGALRLNGVNVSVGDIITGADIAAGKLKFTPGPNANGDGYASFGFQVRDNGGVANGGQNLDQTPNTITFNVTPVNDAPTFSGLAATKTVAENAAAQILDGNVTVGDIEGNFDGGSLTVSQLLAEDMASIRNQGSGATQIGYNAVTGAVSYQGVQIGTAEGGSGEDLVVTLNAAATAAAVEALIENVTYENESDAPTLSRTLRLTVLDAASGAASSLIAVNITPANDAPEITAPSSYAANVGVKRALGGISFADADAGAAQVTATLAVTAGTLTANASAGVAVTGTGTANMTLTGTLAALNAFMAAEKVSFTSDGTGNDPLLTLTIDDGGASGGPAQTDQVVIAISVADNRTGTNGKDVLIGLAEDSHIDGLGGADTISGGGGNDTLLGSAGNDVLNGGIGDDSINGGADTDTASYDGAASGVTVSLAAAGQQNTGGAGLDTLLNVENLLGSDFADALTGDGDGQCADRRHRGRHHARRAAATTRSSAATGST